MRRRSKSNTGSLGKHGINRPPKKRPLRKLDIDPDRNILNTIKPISSTESLIPEEYKVDTPNDSSESYTPKSRSRRRSNNSGSRGRSPARSVSGLERSSDQVDEEDEKDRVVVRNVPMVEFVASTRANPIPGKCIVSSYGVIRSSIVCPNTKEIRDPSNRICSVIDEVTSELTNIAENRGANALYNLNFDILVIGKDTVVVGTGSAVYERPIEDIEQEKQASMADSDEAFSNIIIQPATPVKKPLESPFNPTITVSNPFLTSS
eukprot:TRINITY_DN11566_c0_g1_i1.p1 TRINITY_DN11566_c0_g1~~TRINITY_DN11566_c0_g1_i1.p1  ORF type:complete len:263 (-),score=48.76 TRINITY_DN11566_c0_g1_i1:85-873(-)